MLGELTAGSAPNRRRDAFRPGDLPNHRHDRQPLPREPSVLDARARSRSSQRSCGLKRYRCRECHKSFNALTEHPWRRCRSEPGSLRSTMTKSLSMREAAQRTQRQRAHGVPVAAPFFEPCQSQQSRSGQRDSGSRQNIFSQVFQGSAPDETQHTAERKRPTLVIGPTGSHPRAARPLGPCPMASRKPQGEQLLPVLTLAVAKNTDARQRRRACLRFLCHRK